jgi:hypothetical protein
LDLLFIHVHLRKNALLDLALVPCGQDQGIVNLPQRSKILALVDFCFKNRDSDFTKNILNNVVLNSTRFVRGRKIPCIVL